MAIIGQSLPVKLSVLDLVPTLLFLESSVALPILGCARYCVRQGTF